MKAFSLAHVVAHQASFCNVRGKIPITSIPGLVLFPSQGDCASSSLSCSGFLFNIKYSSLSRKKKGKVFIYV